MLRNIQLLQLVDGFDNTKMTVLSCSRESFGTEALYKAILNEMINTLYAGNESDVTDEFRDICKHLSDGTDMRYRGYIIHFEETNLYEF